MYVQRQRSKPDLQGLKRLQGLKYMRELAEAHCLSLGVDPLQALQHQMTASKLLRQVDLSHFAGLINSNQLA